MNGRENKIRGAFALERRRECVRGDRMCRGGRELERFAERASAEAGGQTGGVEGQFERNLGTGRGERRHASRIIRGGFAGLVDDRTRRGRRIRRQPYRAAFALKRAVHADAVDHKRSDRDRGAFVAGTRLDAEHVAEVDALRHVDDGEPVLRGDDRAAELAGRAERIVLDERLRRGRRVEAFRPFAPERVRHAVAGCRQQGAFRLQAVESAGVFRDDVRREDGGDAAGVIAQDIIAVRHQGEDDGGVSRIQRVMHFIDGHLD